MIYAHSVDNLRQEGNTHSIIFDNQGNGNWVGFTFKQVKQHV